jgi:hypothetical protein
VSEFVRDGAGGGAGFNLHNAVFVGRWVRRIEEQEVDRAACSSQQ